MPRTAFVRKGATVRHEFKDGIGWVELKEAMSVEDRSLVSQAVVSGKIKTSKGSKEIELGELQAGASVIQQLILNVKAWGGPEFDGVPVTVDNILQLTDSVGREIAAKIEELNPEADESGNPTKDEDSKNSGTSTTQP